MSDASDSQLDIEYRAFVRSLHTDTINTVLAVESWWQPGCFRIAALGGYTEDGNTDSKDVAEAIEQDWRQIIHPRLLTLVNGHPDPDVRFAADVLVKRLWSMILIVTSPRHGRGRDRDEENSVAVHLVHDGFERLRRTTYHAPFRINRPSPTYTGVPVGNAEPLPGKMLETINALQAAGVLESDDDSAIIRTAIPNAVRRLSDILFMPEEERAAAFARSSVPDPASSPSQTENDEANRVKFGFSH